MRGNVLSYSLSQLGVAGRGSGVVWATAARHHAASAEGHGETHGGQHQALGLLQLPRTPAEGCGSGDFPPPPVSSLLL